MHQKQLELFGPLPCSERVGDYNPNCADCGLDTFEAGEWYMVHDEIWLQAHVSRSTPNQEILCIGCLEQRIGRTLTGNDFASLPINNPSRFMSDRMRDRLATPPNKRFFGIDGESDRNG